MGPYRIELFLTLVFLCLIFPITAAANDGSELSQEVVGSTSSFDDDDDDDAGPFIMSFFRIKLFLILIFLCCIFSTAATADDENEPSGGIAGSCLSFDGVRDYAWSESQPEFNVPGELTLEAWIYGQFTQNTYQMIARKGSYCYYLGTYGGNPYCRIYTDKWREAKSSFKLNDNTWYHLAMAYNKNEGGFEANDLNSFDILREDADSLIVPDGSYWEFDRYIREIGNVLYEPNYPDPQKVWKLFYSAYNGNYLENNVYVSYAYSADGNNWTKYGIVVNRSGEDPYVVNYHGVYYLYCEDKAAVPFRNIRLYTSTDCENWTDMGVVLNTQTGGTPFNWQGTDVSSPIVWYENDTTWYMLYEGRNCWSIGLIGLATSTDGINWTHYGSDPVMVGGEWGTWDDTTIVSDDIKKVDDTYYMLYHGYSYSIPAGFWEGMATSKDLLNWQRYPFNPVSSETDTIMFFPDGHNGMVEERNNGIRRFHPVVGATMHIYINGIEYPYFRRDDCANAPNNTDSKAMTIGKALGGTAYAFKGCIDEVRLWDRCRSGSEIAMTLNKNLDGNEPNLMAEWEFNEDFGQVAYDSSQYQHPMHLGTDPCGVDNCDPQWIFMYNEMSDFNGDGIVDYADLSLLLNNWLAAVPIDTKEDLNPDGIIDSYDYAFFSNQWQWQSIPPWN
jgi:predicted GH43/DUF377 family glycosyl hydrolase